MEKLATLIVIEGIDGSGKTTLGKRIADTLRAGGHSASWHPNKNLRPVRETLNEIAIESGYADRFAMIGRDEAQFLAAALKWRDLYDLREDLQRPNHYVVVDRYGYTHLALAEVAHTGNAPRLRRLFRKLPQPDLAFFLRVSTKVAFERVTARGEELNSLESLERFAAAYHSLPELRTELIEIDADRGQDEVFANVWDVLTSTTAARSSPAQSHKRLGQELPAARSRLSE